MTPSAMRPSFEYREVSGGRELREFLSQAVGEPGQVLHQRVIHYRVFDSVVAMNDPIFLSYPVAKAVSPRFGLGAQANIRSTM